jgi:NTP pyrophosphatase (non-canonical NTP hydrolase)
MAHVHEREVEARHHFNNLTEAEAERLSVLMEECGEVIQIIGKIQRHGLESKHPKGGPTNRELLQTELGHVCYAMEMMENAKDINFDAVLESIEAKKENITPYLHHQ